MPIRPEQRHHYGRQWRELARKLKRKAGWRCERCGAQHLEWRYRDDRTKYQIVLTVAHLNQDPADNRRRNLAVLCQACHLAHDRPHNTRKAALTRGRKAEASARRAGQLALLREGTG